MEPIFFTSQPTKSLGYTTLIVSNLRRSICLLALPLGLLGYTTLMGEQPKEKPMCSMTVLSYTYGCATVRAAYVCNLSVHNHWVTLHLWVSNLKCSLCLLALPTESLANTILIGAPPWVQPLLVSSAFRNTGMHYTCGCPSLSGGYFCKVFLQNQWVRVHLWVRHLNCSLCL